MIIQILTVWYNLFRRYNLERMTDMYRYREIYSDIRKDILTNHYRSGQPLPTQEELIAKYNVSRLTLKKALQLLSNEGLIYSKQGAGTYVRVRLGDATDEMLPLDSPVGVVYSHRDQDIKSKILHFDARLPDETEQRNLNINKTQPVYEIKRVRFINQEYYSYEHTLMPTEIAPLDKEILKGSLYDYLGSVAKLHLTDARRIVYAQGASPEVAAALNIAPNSPVLVIEQTAYDQTGRPFEYSKSYFINDHSKFVLDVHRQL